MYQPGSAANVVPDLPPGWGVRAGGGAWGAAGGGGGWGAAAAPQQLQQTYGAAPGWGAAAPQAPQAPQQPRYGGAPPPAAAGWGRPPPSAPQWGASPPPLPASHKGSVPEWTAPWGPPSSGSGFGAWGQPTPPSATPAQRGYSKSPLDRLELPSVQMPPPPRAGVDAEKRNGSILREKPANGDPALAEMKSMMEKLGVSSTQRGSKEAFLADPTLEDVKAKLSLLEKNGSSTKDLLAEMNAKLSLLQKIGSPPPLAEMPVQVEPSLEELKANLAALEQQRTPTPPQRLSDQPTVGSAQPSSFMVDAGVAGPALDCGSAAHLAALRAQLHALEQEEAPRQALPQSVEVAPDPEVLRLQAEVAALRKNGLQRLAPPEHTRLNGSSTSSEGVGPHLGELYAKLAALNEQERQSFTEAPFEGPYFPDQSAPPSGRSSMMSSVSVLAREHRSISEVFARPHADSLVESHREDIMAQLDAQLKSLEQDPASARPPFSRQSLFSSKVEDLEAQLMALEENNMLPADVLHHCADRLRRLGGGSMQLRGSSDHQQASYVGEVDEEARRLDELKAQLAALETQETLAHGAAPGIIEAPVYGSVGNGGASHAFSNLQAGDRRQRGVDALKAQLAAMEAGSTATDSQVNGATEKAPAGPPAAAVVPLHMKRLDLERSAAPPYGNATGHVSGPVVQGQMPPRTVVVPEDGLDEEPPSSGIAIRPILSTSARSKARLNKSEGEPMKRKVTWSNSVEREKNRLDETSFEVPGIVEPQWPPAPSAKTVEVDLTGMRSIRSEEEQGRVSQFSGGEETDLTYEESDDEMEFFDLTRVISDAD